jgi:hypothetical protein
LTTQAVYRCKFDFNSNRCEHANRTALSSIIRIEYVARRHGCLHLLWCRSLRTCTTSGRFELGWRDWQAWALRCQGRSDGLHLEEGNRAAAGELVPSAKSPIAACPLPTGEFALRTTRYPLLCVHRCVPRGRLQGIRMYTHERDGGRSINDVKREDVDPKMFGKTAPVEFSSEACVAHAHAHACKMARIIVRRWKSVRVRHANSHARARIRAHVWRVVCTMRCWCFGPSHAVCEHRPLLVSESVRQRSLHRVDIAHCTNISCV